MLTQTSAAQYERVHVNLKKSEGERGDCPRGLAVHV